MNTRYNSETKHQVGAKYESFFESHLDEPQILSLNLDQSADYRPRENLLALSTRVSGAATCRHFCSQFFSLYSYLGFPVWICAKSKRIAQARLSVSSYSCFSFPVWPTESFSIGVTQKRKTHKLMVGGRTKCYIHSIYVWKLEVVRISMV